MPEEPSDADWQQLRDAQPQWFKDGGLGAPPLLKTDFRKFPDEMPSEVHVMAQSVDEPQEVGGAAFDGPGGFGSGDLPDGAEGDMLYHNGTSWVVLAAPAAPGSSYDDPVLRHDGTAPYWQTPEACV